MRNAALKKETDMAYESKFKKEDIDELFEAVLTLRDLEDCYRFFEDICTINEIHAIAQRLQVAKLISKRKPTVRLKQLPTHPPRRSAVSTNVWSTGRTAIREFWSVSRKKKKHSEKHAR